MKLGFGNTFALVGSVLLLVLAGPWLMHEVRNLPGRQSLAARAGERIVTLEVSGMTCQGCAATVKGQLATLPGVSAVEVRLQQDRAYVVCDRSLPDSALVGAVQRGGPSFLAAVTHR